MTDLNTYLQRRIQWARLTREEQSRRIAAASEHEERLATAADMRARAASELAGEFGTDVSEWTP